jgi:purine catabolism regulator
MPLTLAEALQTLPILSSARVVAGKSGLARIIRWTHIVDHAEVLSWVRPGDLLLTTAFALKDNPQSELVMIEQLARQGIAGMLVSIGRYIREVPPETIAAADTLEFPIVIIPWEVPLVEVTHAIHERIIRQQYELTEQIYHIHKVLSQLVLEGGGLEALAKRLSELLGCSVTIEDVALRLQAYASLEPIDEVRRRSIDEGSTPQEIVAHLTGIGLFERLQADPTPQHVAPVPALGMTLERIIAPILVENDLYGYIWIIASQRTLNELDTLAIERAAHIAALILSREQSVFAAEQRIKTRLFENLMDPYSARSTYELQEVMKQFGLHGDYQVIILESRPLNPARLPHLVRLVEEGIQKETVPGAVLEWGQRLIVILSVGHEPGVEETVHTLLEHCAGKGFHLTAGISTSAAAASRVRQCYQEAMQALQAGLALNPGDGGVWHYDKLGFLTWLPGLPQEMRSSSLYLALVEQINAHDRQNGSQHLKTLETYLDCSQNASHTAQVLFIHRNSLLKRLERIQELWKMDFEDPYFVLNLQLAIKDWRLSH